MDFPKVPGERDEQYLGDGVYATFDGFQVILRTPRGGYIGEPRRWEMIALDPYTFDALRQYADGRLTKIASV